MAKPGGPGHSHGRGEREADTTARPRPRQLAGDAPASIAEAQETAARAAQAGRAGGGTTGGRAQVALTHPTGQPGGRPEGHPTRIGRDEDDDVRRSLGRENDAATILAGRGFRVRQNPAPGEVEQARRLTGDTGDPETNPDYLIEGRVFDCYSPDETKDVRGVWSVVEDKVQKGQTQRVVINLHDWGGEMTDLRAQFSAWPMEGLKEVKAITPGGDIVQILPTE
jgi:hypothetical protein